MVSASLSSLLEKCLCNQLSDARDHRHSLNFRHLSTISYDTWSLNSYLGQNSWLKRFWLLQKKFISNEPKNCRVGFATTEFLSTSSKSLQQERRSRCQTSMTWWHFAVRSSPSQIFFFPFFCKSSHRILVQPRKMCLLMAVDMTACNNVQKFLVKR